MGEGLEKARRLDGDERKVFEYFLNNISVGEIIALRELEVLEGVSNPEEVINRLIEKGLLERGTGCINLARDIRERMFRERTVR